MNQSFENLAEQSMVRIPAHLNKGGLHAHTFSMELFAQLIVKECSKLCTEYAAQQIAQSTGINTEFRAHGADDCAEIIKKHFEIE